jgi:putative flippase GtrA
MTETNNQKPSWKETMLFAVIGMVGVKLFGILESLAGYFLYLHLKPKLGNKKAILVSVVVAFLLTLIFGLYLHSQGLAG